MKTSVIFYCLLITFISFSYGQQANYDVSAADGNGFRFWGGNNSYKVHMGNTGEYHYGPVTGYSIKMNMNESLGRGWTWGVSGLTPIAALNNQGNFQVAGNLVALKKLGIGIANPTTYIDIINSEVSESFLRFRVADALDDYFMIANTTTEDGQFIPLLKARHVTDNRAAITLLGEIGPSNDTGNAPVMSFDARKINAEVVNRPLFSWANYSDRLMTLDAQGRLGLGTTTTPKSKLEVKGVITSSSTTSSNYVTSFFVSGDGNAYMNFVGGDADSRVGFQIDGGSAMSIYNDRSVGINTSSTGSHKLAVGGSIGAQEVKVEVGGWSDFVFENDYDLPTLEEVEKYIHEKGHLKDIPSAKEVEKNGIFLGEMNAKLLQKIEELTLYVIETNKENIKLNSKILELEKKIDELKN
ncbi:hypothetical protein [Galbibacter pacificus]|uniref:Peptidase S74 domain-containing protein n=1 Tax=Galbibacter pacificus TaxID=2996052 RepID=A0ABT6FNI6_9FLAO|nr:hypothetical protein [Galbibacter pacificus]MDG3581259.1 hypothetical protein [Galbibacter pacificus]MDG3584737.1 hypothetical protein [Galbibacter pacificus]